MDIMNIRKYTWCLLVTIFMLASGCADMPPASLEEAAQQASAKNLANSYHANQNLLGMLAMAEKGVTIKTPTMEIGPHNVEDVRTSLQTKLSTYEVAIEKRGYASISGAYHTAATPSCEHTQGGWVIGIGGGVLVDLNIHQEGFNVKLVQNFVSETKSYPVEIKGVVVENTLVFTDMMNSDFNYVGDINDATITVRPDVENILAGWPKWVWKKPSGSDLSNCVITLSKI